MRKAQILPLDCCAFYSSKFCFVMREHGFNEEVNCSFVAASEQWMRVSNMFVIIIPVWKLLLMTSLKFHSHTKTMTQLFLSMSIDLQLWNRLLIIYKQEKANRTHVTWWLHDEHLMVRGKCTVLGCRLEGSFQDSWKGQQVWLSVCCYLGDKRGATHQWRDTCAYSLVEFNTVGKSRTIECNKQTQSSERMQNLI